MPNTFLHLGVSQSSEVLAWDMETLNGALVKDLTGNANDGTITGAALNPAGAWGKGRTFNGAGDNVAAAATLNPALPYTAVAWVKPDSTETDSTGVVMGTVKNAAPTGGWRILWDKANTRINVTYHDGGGLRTVNGISTSAPA